MIYAGENEMPVYLGADEIPAIYVGSEQIYPMTVKEWNVKPTEINISGSGGTANIKIASLASWTISASENWVTFSQNSGDSGRTTVVATFTQNQSGSARTANITATDGTSSTTISVSQRKYVELPSNSFVFNYNARDYNPATFTIPKTSGQTMDMDMVWSATTTAIRNQIAFDEDHISVPLSAYSLFDFSTSGANPMNNTASAPAMTIVAKFKVTDTSKGSNFLCNRDNSTFNYMVRTNENGNGALSLSTSGGTILGPTFTTGNTVIAVWRVNANREIDIKNLTNETSSQPVTSSWNTGSKWFSFFMRKRSTTATDWNEPMACDFYWCYATREVLTDAEIAQVVDYNENK